MDRDTDHDLLCPQLCSDGPVGSGLTEQQVAEFLQHNPDFFVSRPHLLQSMTPPSRWNNDAVVDLQHHWMSILRGEIDGLRECASSVIETSRLNLATQVRMHVAVLALLEAADLRELLCLVSDELPRLFDVDMASIALEGVPSAPAEIAILPAGTIDNLLGDDDVVLFGDISDDGLLFGTACTVIRSAALIRLRLGENGVAGLLAFGCCAEETFSPRQGKELLLFLGQVISWCLARQPLALT